MKQPRWQTLHNLGEQFAPQLTPHDSYAKIGRHFGCRKQKIYHEAMVALGKVIYRLRQKIK